MKSQICFFLSEHFEVVQKIVIDVKLLHELLRTFARLMTVQVTFLGENELEGLYRNC